MLMPALRLIPDAKFFSDEQIGSAISKYLDFDTAKAYSGAAKTPMQFAMAYSNFAPIVALTAYIFDASNDETLLYSLAELMLAMLIPICGVRRILVPKMKP